METRTTRRIMGVLSPEKEQELRKVRQQIAEELPDLQEQLKVLTRASQEPTPSGQLRSAIHASGLLLNQMAAKAGITSDQLHAFLLGEHTLPSDVFDRLAGLLAYELRPISQA